MDLSEVQEIIACLPAGRTFFHYFKDRYALLLLAQRASAQGVRIGTLRQSPYAPLLDKPVIKQALASCGSGRITAADLLDYWPGQPQTLLLKLAHWGGDDDRRWQQTCRPGYNLVLQLVFANDHDTQYRRLLKPAFDGYFNFHLHPIAKRRPGEFYRETLAWARIDLDWQTGEALIEEIQSDWIARAAKLQRQLRSDCSLDNQYDLAAANRSLVIYLDQVLAQYSRLWDEAMLSATIDFIRRELGLKSVFYHEFETGAVLKGIDYCKPPRSLYTRLPRRFCLEPVHQVPLFLQRDKTTRRVLRRIKKPVFFKLH